MLRAGIADVVNIADIADRMLRTLRWRQVDAYKVLRGCPVIVSYKHIYKIFILGLINLNQSAKTLDLIDLISIKG